ncbi:ABC transporter permease [Desulfosporosinus fructosivorans]
MAVGEARAKESESSSYKTRLRKGYEKFGIIAILFGITILMSILSDRFLTSANIINIIRQVSFIAIIALGATAIIITTGIDLSAGSIVGITSVVVASYAHPGQNSLIVVLFVGLAVGTIAGLVNGTLIAKTGIPPFIVTMGMYTTARGLALLYSDGRPISNLSPNFIFLGAGHVLGIPVPIIILAVVAILTHFLLNNTRLGRHIYAVGGNEQAAVISGINVNRVKIFVYAFAGFLASLSGLILTARIYSGQPGLGVGFELDAIAAAVIGGTSLNGGVGTVIGTICGALVVGVINNGMDLMGVNMYWQQITKGGIIVLAVLLDMQKNRKKA